MPQLNSTVSVLPSSTAAQTVRGQLEAAGIESAIVEAEGAFRLQVSENDFMRAMQLLFPLPTAPQLAALEVPGAGPWKCARCGEEVQPVSDVCWACGQPRGEAPVEAAPSTSTNAAAPPVAPPPLGTPPRVPPPAAAPISAVPASAAPASVAPASVAPASAVPPPVAAGPTAAPNGAAAPPKAAAVRSAADAQSDVQERFVAAPAAAGGASSEGPRRKRSSREPTIEEPNAWRDPWLIGFWVLIGVSICVIAWLALR
jgi:hypothetical protein